MTTQRLIDDLTAARQDLLDALDRVAHASMTTPGLVGEWSGREVIAHVGYWAGNAVEVANAVDFLTGRSRDRRLEEAMRLLCDPAADRRSVIEISFEVRAVIDR